MSRRRLILCAVFVSVLAGGVRAESDFNVDCFFGWGGCYRPMEWMPVEIEMSSTLKEPFAGSVHVAANQDGLNNLNITNHFVLTPDIRLHIPLVTKLAFAASDCRVRVTDERGRTQWSHTFELWDFSQKINALTAVNESDLLIGFIGARKAGLFGLETQAVCTSDRGDGKVYVRDKVVRMVPWDWTAFVSLDLLILYDPDWSTFNKNQLEAISQWVLNGGKLLIILGSHPMIAENPISKVLPVQIADAKQIKVSAEKLNEWGLEADNSETLVCWPLKPMPDASFYETQENGEGECIFAAGYSGFGRVGVLSFDPAGMSETQKTKLTAFWVGRIKAVLKDSAISSPNEETNEESARVRGQYRSPSRRPGRVNNQFATQRSIKLTDNDNDINKPGMPGMPPGNQYQYQMGRAQTANNGVLEYLYNISELRPLSIWWVIFLLGLLALLLGPIDYKVLKHYDRLPLTWITSAFWIIVFSIGAYYGVQALRGGTLQFRVVSVIDGVEKSNCIWSTEYCGLFAPRSDNYELKGLKGGQWWSAISPVQDYSYAYRQQGAMGRNVYCYQHDGSNQPYSLPVNIWTMQCLMKESAEPKMPIEATVERVKDEVTISITNKSEVPIKSGYVLFGGNEAFDFGSVEAYSTKKISGNLKPFKSWNAISQQAYSGYTRYPSGYDQQYKFENETAYLAQGCLQRTTAMNGYLARGAAAVCVEMDNAPVSFGVKDRLCNYTHKQVCRLIVFPKQQERKK